MKVTWKYISHFWYVAINWNIWMAFFMLYDNIRGSAKYGGGTFIPVELKKLTLKGDPKRASRYEAVSFYMLEKLLSAFTKISGDRSIIDLGCGKGRVMMVAPHYGFTQVKGIDFAKEVCEQAIINMERTEKKFPSLQWKVLHENVEQYTIDPDDCVFFLFNPFDEIILQRFLKRLDVSCNEHPRTVYFLYASPLHGSVLLDNGYAVIYQKQRMYVKGMIAVRE